MSFNNNSPRSILVRMPTWLGDLMMAIPLLEDLKTQWPSAEISVLCPKAFAEVLKGHPAVDHIIPFVKPKGIIRKILPIKILQSLRQKEYDLGILTTNSFSSAWWFFLSKISCRIGFKSSGRGLLLNYAPPFPEKKHEQHLVITYKALLAPLGIPLSQTSPKIYISEREILHAKSNLKQLGISETYRIIGINPGAAFGQAKCWIPERFAEVANTLAADRKTAVIFFGAPDGKPLVDLIMKDVSSRLVFNLAGKTSIRELAAYIKACDLLLTNDSGPMHLACAVSTPVVAIFGSTSPIATGPYPHGTIISKNVSCSPCFSRKCPIDFRCMLQITVNDVLEKIHKALI